MKQRSIAEAIIAPLAQQLQQQHDLTVIGGARVQSLGLTDGEVSSITYSSKDGEKVSELACMAHFVLVHARYAVTS